MMPTESFLILAMRVRVTHSCFIVKRPRTLVSGEIHIRARIRRPFSHAQYFGTGERTLTSDTQDIS